MRGAWISWVLVAAAGGAAGAGSGCTSGSPASTPPPSGTRTEMVASANCGQCHADHFNQWAQSMHAKAADDPVFIAMNARGQRETKGKLGNFCVQCHAPMAVRDGKTDGSNPGSLPSEYKGVTCYFCHSIDGVEADGGKSNASVHLADDLVMRGEIPDPVANSFHASAPSTFQNSHSPDSATMCGYCHDIDSPAGAPIERTFAEWSETPFATAGTKGGLTCTAVGTCHMSESANVLVATGGKKTRSLHSHDFSAVDVPVSAKPVSGAVAAVQGALNNNVLLGALCVTKAAPAISVILDTNGVGHHWPSGAAQDRRAWIEVKAYDADGGIIYQSGVVSPGASVTDTAATDPDLWLLRDCMFDSQKKETHNFWEAATVNGSSELPPLASFDPSDPNNFKSHIHRSFPSMKNSGYPSGTLKGNIAKVTMRVLIQPVGLDVLNDLVDSGDLDPGPDGAVLANMPRFEVSLVGPNTPGGLEWPAPPSQVAQNLVSTVDTGPATCTASSGFIAVGQVPGTTAATCDSP